MDDKQHILQRHFQQNRRKKNALWVFFLLTILGLITDIVVGSHGLTFSQVFKAIFMPHHASLSSRIIVWDIRMPTSLMAPLVGGALALAGAQMQTTLNNPLADPYTFGVSAAAGVGASLVITNLVALPFIPSQYQVMVMAFIFCLATTFLIAGISSIKRIGIQGVMLFGVALMFGYDSILTMMHYIASENQLQTLIFWQMGSLQRSDWGKIVVLAVVLPVVLIIMMKDAWKLSALKMGSDRVQILGVNLGRLRLKVLVLVSIITSLAVSFVGAIGFVGLVAPHIARMIVGEDQRFFLPSSFLVGAFLLELGSIASKSIIVGIILPLTVVMSMVGIPFFIFLILKKGQQNGA